LLRLWESLVDQTKRVCNKQHSLKKHVTL